MSDSSPQLAAEEFGLGIDWHWKRTALAVALAGERLSLELKNGVVSLG